MDASPVPTDDHATARQRNARLALAAFLFGLGAWTLHSYLPALVWAVILAIALWPIFERAEARLPHGKHNVLVPALFTAGVALLFVAPLGLVGIEVAREAHGIAAWLQEARNSGIPVPDWVGHLPFGAGAVSNWWQENLAKPDAAAEHLRQVNHGEFVSYGREIGAGVLHRLVIFAFTLLTLFFLFQQGRAVTAQMLTASRRAFGPRGEAVGRQMVASVRGTVNGLVLVGLGEGALMGVAYVIAGAPHPAMLGVATAVAAMVPFGAPLAFGLATILLLAQGSTIAAVVILVTGFVVSFVADHAFRPALIGGTTRLPFLWVLLGILGGVETWGLLGLFLGPAVMAALILLWRDATGPGVAAEAG